MDLELVCVGANWMSKIKAKVRRGIVTFSLNGNLQCGHWPTAEGDLI